MKWNEQTLGRIRRRLRAGLVTLIVPRGSQPISTYREEGIPVM